MMYSGLCKVNDFIYNIYRTLNANEKTISNNHYG